MSAAPFKRYLVRQIGEGKGRPRVYLDMPDLERAGFTPGKCYKRDVSLESKRITLTLVPNGDYVVCKKEKGGKQWPVIDLHSADALKPFEGMEAVRIVLDEDRIHILPLASEAKRAERLARMSRNLEAGALHTAGAAFGGGVLDHAAHTGLHASGIHAKLVMANEIDEGLLDHAQSYNDCVLSDTTLISAPMQELVQDEWAMNRLPKADLLCMGIPCSGARALQDARNGHFR
ncbi:hypothetical protein LP417_35060 (plasmid) [Polaromonas sp. P1-6]|nr:hypothetical protein LP417_35060 [Polaromonas sp. P1-6]